MIDDLLSSFPNIISNGCLKNIENEDSYIFENTEIKQGVFVTVNQKYHLHVQKTSNRNLYFIQNDDCVMNSDDGKQCDYILFNDNTVFFCEIKATNKNLSKRRKEALKQIENTIKFYFKKELFINHERKNALITFDNKKTIAPQASKSTKRKEFKVKYDVNLDEGNYILFE